MSVAVSVRIPETLMKKLDGVTEETERPRSFHIQKALETYLQDYVDLQIALDRLRDPTDPVISSREIAQLF